MPYPNEHSARLKSPGAFDSDSFRRKVDGTIYGKIKVPTTVSVIWGKLKGKSKPSDMPIPQALRFPTKDWTVAQAKSWLSTNKVKFIKFEPASGTKSESERPIVDSHARRVVVNYEPELGAKSAKPGRDHGSIWGYAAVFDVIDSKNEVFRKGAFAKSIQERVAAGKVKLMLVHFAYGGDVPQMIGTVDEMKEDEVGLYFHSRLSSIQSAQDARTLAIEGHVTHCSIGFSPVRHRWTVDVEREILEHLECKVLEVTLTARPVNEGAVITGAKSFEPVEIVQLMEQWEAKIIEAETTAEEGSSPLDALGGVEGCKALGKSLKGLAGRLDALVSASEAAETQDTKIALADPVSMEREIELRRKRLSFPRD